MITHGRSVFCQTVPDLDPVTGKAESLLPIIVNLVDATTKRLSPAEFRDWRVVVY